MGLMAASMIVNSVKKISCKMVLLKYIAILSLKFSIHINPCLAEYLYHDFYSVNLQHSRCKHVLLFYYSFSEHYQSVN